MEDLIEEQITPDHFQYEIQQIKELPHKFPQITVLVLNYKKAKNSGMLDELLERKKNETGVTKGELVLSVEPDDFQEVIEKYREILTDIWVAPYDENLVHFRIQKLIERIKFRTDFWLTQTYLDTAINSVPDLVWFKDKKGAHVKVNDSFCRTVKKTHQQIQNRGHYYIWDIKPEDYKKGEFICVESEYEVMNKKQTCLFNEVVKVGDELRNFKTFKSPLFDLDGTVMGTVGIARDVTKNLLYEKMILDNANRDFLTGLYNRRYLYQYLETIASNPFALFYLDLDNFKSVNDNFGHQEGDRALLLVRDKLKEILPEKAMISRVGGDEFLVILVGNFTAEAIEEQAQKIQDALDSALKKELHFKNVGASVGVAYSPHGEIQNVDKLIEQADKEMYQQKTIRKSK